MLLARPREVQPWELLSGGIGLRGGAPKNEAGDPLFAEETTGSKLVLAMGVDAVLHQYRIARPILTARYIHARRSEQEQFVGLGGHVFRVGVGVELGPR